MLLVPIDAWPRSLKCALPLVNIINNSKEKGWSSFIYILSPIADFFWLTLQLLPFKLMVKTSNTGQFIYRLLTIGMLLIIIIYQVKLDARLSKLDHKTQQTASSAAAAELSIEEVKKELNAVTERLGI